MQIHLIDGTYELFRAYFGSPAAAAPDGTEVGAARGLARSLISLLRDDGTTHVAVAFDHVIESFRNGIFEGYKRGDGVAPDLLAQFGLAERLARALGLTVWPMVEFEADDALASAAARWVGDERIERIVICSPDKDLAQCVTGGRVVCLDRRRKRELDETGVREKFGVAPGSMPDWLALVGDSADGIPGIPRWGARSSSAVLGVYERIEAIPDEAERWTLSVRGAPGLAASLRERRVDALLYRRLATLRTDVPLTEELEDLEWKGAHRGELQALCERTGDPGLLDRVPRWT